MASPTPTASDALPQVIDLNSLRIASPCHAKWDAMEGDDRRRYCAGCSFHVYDLSHLTTDEARALVASHEGERVCIRLHRRADGTVITRDCPVGVKARVKRRRWMAFIALAGLPWAARGWSAMWAAFSAEPTPPPRSAPVAFDEGWGRKDVSCDMGLVK